MLKDDPSLACRQSPETLRGVDTLAGGAGVRGWAGAGAAPIPGYGLLPPNKVFVLLLWIYILVLLCRRRQRKKQGREITRASSYVGFNAPRNTSDNGWGGLWEPAEGEDGDLSRCQDAGEVTGRLQMREIQESKDSFQKAVRLQGSSPKMKPPEDRRSLPYLEELLIAVKVNSDRNSA